MDFGDAINQMRRGHKLTRAGWNGKGMWVELQYPDELSKMTLPYLYLNYPTGNKVPWFASQTDMLSNDWRDLTTDLDFIPNPVEDVVYPGIKRAAAQLCLFSRGVFPHIDAAYDALREAYFAEAPESLGSDFPSQPQGATP